MEELKVMAYHGTGVRFNEFECKAYFSEYRETAVFFAKRCVGVPCVYSCFLVFNNPLIVYLGGQSWGGIFLSDDKIQEECIQYATCGDLEEVEYYKEEGITINILGEYAEEKGYDGVIAYDCYEEDGSRGIQYVVLSPKQIEIVCVETLEKAVSDGG